MASTTAPAMIGIDSSFMAGNDRSSVPQFTNAITGTSGVVAAATATATLPAVVGKTNYCTGIELDYQGATVATVVVGTLTGTIGGTRAYDIPVPAGAGIIIFPLIVQFDPPLQANSTNTAIIFTVPSLGAGNTSSQTSIDGYLV